MAIAELKDLPSPEEFYEKHILPRQPVVFRGCLSAFAPKLSNLTVEDLTRMTSLDTLIEVNEAQQQPSSSSSSHTSFSPAHSKIKNVLLHEFLKELLPKGNHYMTTQPLPLDDEGRPAIYSSPITELIQDKYLELQPPLWGNLIPMTYNLWIGNSNSNDSSSGLHHDYHDNLYCLIHGTKTFHHLAPPESVLQMQHNSNSRQQMMQGTLHKIHSNGRIVYREQLQENEDDDGIRPDGALESVDRLVELELRKESIERQQRLANDTQTKRSDNDSNDFDDTEIHKAKLILEEQLNEVEEALLNYEMGKQQGRRQSCGGSDDEDNDDNECLLFGGCNGAAAAAVDDDDESDLKSNCDDGDESCHSDSSSQQPMAKKVKLETASTQIPPNFCMKEPPDSIKFESITIHEGDMLYLPAGWFHNVQSKNGLHMALNYWMHPIDVGPDVSFEKPYLSPFWERDWASRGLAKSK